MFETMRRNTKLIMWITTLSFVLLIFIGWGMEYTGLSKQKGPSAGMIGSVNGQQIRATVYQDQINQMRANMQAQGQTLDEGAEVQIRDQAWNSMIQQMLLDQEIKKRNITVSDKEIVEAIKTQPLQQIMQSPDFQTGGKFDYSKYLQALNDPNRDWTALESYYRSDLPKQKLESLVISSAKVTDADVRRQFETDNEKANVAYALVPSQNFKVDPQSIDDAALRAYYDGHKDDYRTDAQASVEFVRIEKRPSAADSSDASDTIQQALKEAKGGEDFATLVSAYSEAPVQLRGGEQGVYVTKDQISAPKLRDAVFSLPVGQMSDIIEEQGGYHLIKVEDHRKTAEKEDVKFADIFVPISLSSETITGYQDKAEAILNGTREAQGNLAEEAQKQGLQVQTAGPFGRKTFLPRLGQISGLMDWVFNSTPGKVNAMETAEGWYVIRLTSRQPAGVPPLEAIKDRVRSDAVAAQQTDAAKQQAETILNAARSGTPLETAAKSVVGATYGTSDNITRHGFSKDIPGEPAVMIPLFSDAIGLVPRVLASRRGAYVIQILSRTEPDSSQFAGQKDQIRRQLLQRKRSDIVNRWMEELRDKAKIEDYRTYNGI